MSLALALQHVLPAPAIRRELLVLAAALACGVLVVPPILWTVGSHALGPYAGDGIGSFLSSFLRGLGAGTFGFWMVALGPYLVTLLARALLGLARGAPSH
ncbi:MAG: hypothetical protein ACREUG_03920 [Steroidobacteraceae bacterium]